MKMEPHNKIQCIVENLREDTSLGGETTNQIHVLKLNALHI